MCAFFNKYTMEPLIVNAIIKASLEKTWRFFTEAEHVVNWNFAHESWHCPKAENDLSPGGEFFFTMAAKDKSASFVFHGTYTEVIPLQKIEYFIEDGRKVEVFFHVIDENTTEIFERFEPEQINALEMQEQGWQAILNQFKSYVESN